MTTSDAIYQQMAAVEAARERLRLERDKLARLLEEAKAERLAAPTR